MPSSSWKEFLAQDCQGTTVRSFVFTRGGAGDYRLTWEVDLPRKESMRLSYIFRVIH